MPVIVPPSAQSPTETPVGPVVVGFRQLVATGILLESVVALVRRQPLYLFALPFWMLAGPSAFREQVTRRATLDVSILPLRNEVIQYLSGQSEAGRSLILVAGGNIRLARELADRLGIFDSVVTGNGSLPPDLPVVRPKPRPGTLLRVLRPTHWLKNVLVFVPVCAAHRFTDTIALEMTLLAFIALGCGASGGYLLNDLLDLEADRHHPQKRHRAFAAGELPLSWALLLMPLLFSLALLLGTVVSGMCLWMVAVYIVLSGLYSLVLKKVAILDVLTLAALYSVRLIVGAVAAGAPESTALLEFSTFLFFSLALVKRYGELVVMRKVDGKTAKARGYELGDGELLAAMGTASGYIAVLVLMLYIGAEKARSLYAHPALLWFLCPLLFYWVSYIWLTAHRGKLGDEPLVFAISNLVSGALLILMAVTAILAV